MTDIVVTFKFTEAWELLNAIEQRLEILGAHAERFPESDEIVAAMGRLISGRDKMRESLSLVDRLTAASIVAASTVAAQDVPIAAWDHIPEALETYWNRGA